MLRAALRASPRSAPWHAARAVCVRTPLVSAHVPALQVQVRQVVTWQRLLAAPDPATLAPRCGLLSELGLAPAFGGLRLTPARSSSTMKKRKKKMNKHKWKKRKKLLRMKSARGRER